MLPLAAPACANDEGRSIRRASAFAAIRPEQEKIVQQQAEFGPALCILALIDAGLGRKEDALRESRRAVELVPMEKDALTEQT